jgi:hypothetical protein
MHQLPIPASGTEFERLVAAMLEKVFGVPPSKAGREGQAQFGIDFIVTARGTTFGVQCKKRTSGGSLKPNLLRRDILGFSTWVSASRHPYCCFMLFTTLPSDSGVQRLLLEIMAEHDFKFDAMIYFWEDIELMLYNLPDVLQRFYGEFIRPDEQGGSPLPLSARTDPGLALNLQTLASRWREAQDIDHRSVMLDHSTLSFVSDLSQRQSDRRPLSNFHLPALDQFLESLLFTEKIYVAATLDPPRWQRSDIGSSLAGIVSPLVFTPHLSEAVSRAAGEWLEDFWTSRSSRGFLGRLLHAQVEIASDRLSVLGDSRDKFRHLNMLKREASEVVVVNCQRMWNDFFDESLKAHRTLPRLGTLARDDWEKLLTELKPVGLSLIYWMFYRTFYYQTHSLALGGMPYFCHPLRSSALLFESSGRNHNIASLALSYIKKGDKQYQEMTDKAGWPVVRSIQVPPVSHYILNQVDGDLTQAIGYALTLRERDDVRELRNCFSELEEARRKDPARLTKVLNGFQRVVHESVARWGRGQGNRIIMALSSPAAMVGRLRARFGIGFVYRYASFYKSLVDAIGYHNYGQPHLRIEMRRDYEESEAQAIIETAGRADRPWRLKRPGRTRGQLKAAKRRPKGGIFRNLAGSAGEQEVKRLLSFMKRSEYDQLTVRRIVDTFGGWGT